MKHVIFGIVGFFTVILVIMIQITIAGKDVQDVDTSLALPQAADSAMELVLSETSYSVQDSQELIDAFVFLLSESIEGESTLKVDIIKADYETGTLSVVVTQSYRNPDGEISNVEYPMTVMLEVTEEDVELVKKMRTINYIEKINYPDGTVNEVLVSSYTIVKGDALMVPDEPAGAVWTATDGAVAVAGEPVTENKNYYYTHDYVD